MPATNLARDDLEHLYRNHHQWLHGLLCKKAGNRFDACELAHDVFVLLLKKPRRFDSFDGARAYLSTLAQGLSTDLLRRRALERAWLEAMALRPEAAAPSPEERAIILETLNELAAMLQRLPAKAANAFILAHVDGLRYHEIAGQLGVSERMVKKYIAQAMLHCALIRNGFADGGHAADDGGGSHAA